MKLYGIAEVAAALGVSSDLVSQWRFRGYLPEPTALLAVGPVWDGRRIGPWIAHKRRELAARRVDSTAR